MVQVPRCFLGWVIRIGLPFVHAWQKFGTREQRQAHALVDMLLGGGIDIDDATLVDIVSGSVVGNRRFG